MHTFWSLPAASINSSAFAWVLACRVTWSLLGANGGEVLTGELVYAVASRGALPEDLFEVKISKLKASRSWHVQLSDPIPHLVYPLLIRNPRCRNPGR